MPEISQSASTAQEMKTTAGGHLVSNCDLDEHCIKIPVHMQIPQKQKIKTSNFYKVVDLGNIPNTLHMPLIQTFLLLPPSKQGVPSMTASSIFSEKWPSMGRQ